MEASTGRSIFTVARSLTGLQPELTGKADCTAEGRCICLSLPFRNALHKLPALVNLGKAALGQTRSPRGSLACLQQSPL